MVKSKNEPAQYQSFPEHKRFWIYSEYCYTEVELSLRQTIIKARQNSGIHPDFLNNPSSWFTEDAQALINVYERSWFYSNAFKPRHVLSRDDFHVQPIDRLQWPALFDLMQQTGDYLLKRNSELSENHLNQPMNYALLDINQMLKSLSKITDINQVKEQLELITKYIRSIEKHISPLMGSDRLFLANFRNTVEDEIQPQLMHKIESQLLRDRLQEVSKSIHQLSTDRNRILHFALNVNPVKPHSYDFSNAHIEEDIGYPTQAVKKCAQASTDLSIDATPVLSISIDGLKNCANFDLISMDDDVLNHYSKAISDLNELDRFQRVITQIIELLGQAGEVYTVFQFKEQMLSLLKQIDGFIDDSSTHIEELIKANTQAYHRAIQNEQKLPFLKKWLTSENAKLSTYIKNQDTLAQFPSTSADLLKTNNALKEHVAHVIGHLSQPKAYVTTFAGIADKAQELDKLMGSMHHWIKTQYKIKGLEAPKAPEPLIIAPPPLAPLKTALVKKPPAKMSLYQGPTLFTPQQDVCKPCSANDSLCESNGNPSGPLSYSALLASLIAAPVVLILLFILLKRHRDSYMIPNPEDKNKFENLKTEIDDLITQIAFDDKTASVSDIEEYEDLTHKYKQLINQCKRERFNIEGMKSLYEDLKEFQEDLKQSDSEDLGNHRF